MVVDSPMTSRLRGRRETGLPASWTRVTLGETAHINPRDASIRSLPDELPVSFVPMAAVEAEHGTISSSDERSIAQVRKGFTPFRDGDVIWAKITPCMENGKAAVAKGLRNELGFGSTEFHVIRPGEGVLSAWLFHFLRQTTLRDLAKVHFSGAVGQQRVPASFLLDTPIPLAPAAEQHRIVAEIEKQFSRLDAAVAALKRAQANLRRYRASVLKAAWEGRLVPQDPNDEPAGKLLRRVRAAHSCKQDTPSAPSTSEDTHLLGRLPAGWTWTSVCEIASDEPRALTDGPFGSNLKTEHYTPTGPRVIRLQNVGDGVFRNDEAHISGAHFQSLSRHMVIANDIVIAALGDSLPRSCIVPGFVGPAIVKADCIRFKPNPHVAEVRYLNAVLNSEPLKRYARSITHGIGRPRLNLREIKALPIPLPPLAEQRRIAADVERRLSVVDGLETAVQANLKRAERLRQAILKRAFEGRLVPQDPSDEPAAVLLERIRAQRRRQDPIRRSREGNRKGLGVGTIGPERPSKREGGSSS